MVLPSEDDPGVLAVKASLALDPPDLAGKSEKEAREALLARCKAVLREQHIAMHGRPKKTRDEMLVELEAHPLFLAFQDEVHKLPKLRASTAVKVLKGVDPLISKEYKQALLESMQRRARTKHDTSWLLGPEFVCARVLSPHCAPRAQGNCRAPLCNCK